MSELVSQYLRIDEPNHADNSIVEFEYIEYLPRDTDMDKGSYLIETRDEDVYLLPHKAVIEIRGNLTKDSGSLYNADDAVTLVNNGLSLFRSAQYQINNHTVEEINDWLPYASTILNLVMYSDDYSRSIATNMLWYRDTATGKPNMTEFDMTESFPVSIASDVVTVKAKQIRDMKLVTNPQYNRGFHARQLLTTGDKQISLLIPLSSIFGFCKDVDTVFRGVKHTLQLDRAATANYILKDSNIDDGKFKISHVSMWMPKVTPSLEVASQLEAKLVSGHISNLYFEQVKVYMTQYAANQTSPTWRITTQPGTELPRHIFIVFQSTERENNQTMNNMIFDNADVRRISARINSIQYPEREIECNFHPSNRNYSRPYMMFMEAVHKYQDTDTGSQLSAEDWANLYPIFHFDVSKHNERLKNSPADIEVKWTLGKNFKSINNNSNDVPYYVYAVVLTDRYLQLHGLGGRMNVIV
ncbi:TPA_asm: hexon [Trichoplax MELD virus]|nr:TPA_asm: hexon [Trichoplax MELD virus]